MPSNIKTFRQLVEAVRTEGLGVDQRPRSITEIAEICKVSRPCFYTVLRGSTVASPPVMANLYHGLKKIASWVTREDLAAAVQRTRSRHLVDV